MYSAMYTTMYMVMYAVMYMHVAVAQSDARHHELRCKNAIWPMPTTG